MVLVELDNIIIQLLRLLVTVDEMSLEEVIRETLINVEVVDEEELPKMMIMIMIMTKFTSIPLSLRVVNIEEQAEADEVQYKDALVDGDEVSEVLLQCTCCS